MVCLITARLELKKTNKQTKCILIKRRKPKGKFDDDSEWIGTNSVWGVFLPT